MTTENTRIKGCPFCADTEGIKITEIDHETFEIECQNVYCMFQPSGVFESEQEAIEWWNKRPLNKDFNPDNETK